MSYIVNMNMPDLRRSTARISALLLAWAGSVAAAALPPPTIYTTAPIGTLTGASWVSAFDTNSNHDLSQVLMQYSFRINGPQNESVPVDVDYFLYASGSVASNIPLRNPDFSLATVRSTALVSVLNVASRVIFSDTTTYVENGLGVPQNTNAYQIEHGAFLMPTNTTWFVRLLASVSAGGFRGVNEPISGYSGSGYAYADPFLAIEPMFVANNPGYFLEFSPGIQNVVSAPPVPEPGTFLLVVLGGLFFGVRRLSSSLKPKPENVEP